MCRPDGRHVLNNQGTDDYVLTKERKRQVLHIENKIKYDLLHILWCIAMR